MVWVTESWRDCVKRIAGRQRMEQECLKHFDREVADGTPEREAAFNALYEWDCADYDNRTGKMFVQRISREVR